MSGNWYQGGVKKEDRRGLQTLWTPRPLVYTYSSGRDGHRKQLGTGGGARAEGGDDEFAAAGIPTVIKQKRNETTKATWLTQQPDKAIPPFVCSPPSSR